MGIITGGKLNPKEQDSVKWENLKQTLEILSKKIFFLMSQVPRKKGWVLLEYKTQVPTFFMWVTSTRAEKILIQQSPFLASWNLPYAILQVPPKSGRLLVEQK